MSIDEKELQEMTEPSTDETVGDKQKSSALSGYKEWQKEKVHIEYLEREVQVIDTAGFQVVRREWFAKSACPAITIKYGKIYFNLVAIRKLGCEFILPLLHADDKKLMIRPCDPNLKEALQWSYTSKQGKLQHRDIGARKFTEKLYYDMRWPTECTVKCLGAMLICKGEKAFIFEFDNTEMYSVQSVRDENNENRRVRREYVQRELWDNYGKPVDEYEAGLIRTLDDLPDDYVVFEKFSNTRRVEPSATPKAEQTEMSVSESRTVADGEDGNGNNS